MGSGLGVFRVNVHYWLVLRCLKRNLHEDEFFMHAGLVFYRHVIIGREKVKSAIWPQGYMTTSKVVKVGIERICALEHAGPEKGVNDPYS